MEMPSTFGEWFICLVALVVGLERFFSFYQSYMKETPEPAKTYATILTVEKHVESTEQALGEHRRETHQEIEAHRSEVKEALQQQDTELGKLRDERRADVRALHEEIREVDRKQTATTAQTEMMNQELKNIGSKLDRVAERLPARKS